MGMKILGYALSAVGLGLIVVSAESVYSNLPLSFIPGKVILVAGVAAVAVGVVFLMGKGGRKRGKKIKQAKEEVPIYDGQGDERKIVAYQKE